MRPMTHDKHQHKSPTVHDAQLEYHEQQEQKQLAFEADQERKRQEFEAKLEHQKAKREWLMLIITVVAVAASTWTAYEARKARIEAAKLGAESLEKQDASVKAQQTQNALSERLQTKALTEQRLQAAKAYELQAKSLQTQIDAIQLDERPFVFGKITEITLSKSKDWNGTKVLYGFEGGANVLLVYSGRTAPLSITVSLLCTQGAFSRPNQVEDTVKYWRSFGLTIHVEPNEKEARGGTSCGLTLPNQSPNILTIFGVITYVDVFKHSHESYFCETSHIPDALLNAQELFGPQRIELRLGSCSGTRKRT